MSVTDSILSKVTFSSRGTHIQATVKKTLEPILNNVTDLYRTTSIAEPSMFKTTELKKITDTTVTLEDLEVRDKIRDAINQAMKQILF